MKGRWLSIGVLAAAELLAGIGLRNEGLAARAQAEACRRRQRITEARFMEHAAFLALHYAPHRVAARVAAREALRSRIDRNEL